MAVRGVMTRSQRCNKVLIGSDTYLPVLCGVTCPPAKQRLLNGQHCMSYEHQCTLLENIHRERECREVHDLTHWALNIVQ